LSQGEYGIEENADQIGKTVAGGVGAAIAAHAVTDFKVKSTSFS